MQWLDKALAQDRSHYPSLRARTLAHYTRGDYAAMAVDADRCITLRQQDASGWSLRAVALRELSQLDEAMTHHNRAVALAPDDAEGYVVGVCSSRVSAQPINPQCTPPKRTPSMKTRGQLTGATYRGVACAASGGRALQ